MPSTVRRFCIKRTPATNIWHGSISSHGSFSQRIIRWSSISSATSCGTRIMRFCRRHSQPISSITAHSWFTWSCSWWIWNCGSSLVIKHSSSSHRSLDRSPYLWRRRWPTISSIFGTDKCFTCTIIWFNRFRFGCRTFWLSLPPCCRITHSWHSKCLTSNFGRQLPTDGLKCSKNSKTKRSDETAIWTVLVNLRIYENWCFSYPHNTHTHDFLKFLISMTLFKENAVDLVFYRIYLRAESELKYLFIEKHTYFV